MKRFSRLLIVFAVSTGLVLPEKIALACGPWPAPPEDFRLSLFDPSIGDKNNEFQPYYFSLNQYYKADGIEDFATDIEVDQNYAEWKSQLESHFTKLDFYKAVEQYSYKIVADSANDLRKSNSFINALMDSGNPDYFTYFKLAKSTEGFNGVDASTDVWGLNNVSSMPDSLQYHLTYTLQHTKNKFIQQRTAYLLCRLFFYKKNVKALQSVYDVYLNKTNVHSWVKASAKYYFSMLKYADSTFTKDYCRALVDIIDASKDKRLACIKILNQQPPDSILPLLGTSRQKAIVLAAYAVRNPGYALNSISQIYLLDHSNKFLPILINREINKIEDWLLTPSLTEYNIPASRDDYWDDNKDSNHTAVAQNIIKDRRYAKAVLAFVKKINSRVANDKLNYNAHLCHLNFLLKDYKASSYYCNQILANSTKNSAVWMQARINTVVIELQQKKQYTALLKNHVFRLLTYLDNVQDKYMTKKQYKSSYSNDYTVKDNLLIYLGRTALKMHDVVNASLLLSGTDKPWGEYETGDNKNAYFLLYQYANEDDFNKLINILCNKHQTQYEKYFTKRKVEVNGNFTISPFYYGYSDRVNFTYLWNANKVLDLEGTYLVKKDDLNKALTVFRQIPASFWTDSNNVYRDNLTGNPFVLNIYNTHEYNKNSYNNPDKAQFIEKLISLKRRAVHTYNTEEKAELYYIIGNAYYSQSFYGKFWMMSKLWWSTGELYDLDAKHITAFDLNYYGTVKAKEYYLKALSLTKNPKRAAFYCIYVTNCENNRRKLINKTKNTDYNYDPSIYLSLLSRHSGSQQFYKQLIEECPLYSAFRNNIEKQN